MVSSIEVARHILPYFCDIGSAKFRRWVVDMIPHQKVQQVKSIVDTMDSAATSIFNEKKRALRAGDEAIIQQVGEGKDIMSKLSESYVTRGYLSNLTDRNT